MKKKIVMVAFLFTAAFVAGFSANNIFAAGSTKGQQELENKINAEEARLAELKVELNSSLGINHTLRRKSRGNDVKLLQKFLTVYGVYPEGLITGYFGPLTDVAVRRFQAKEAIDVVGIVGPKTRRRIFEVSREKSEAQTSKGASNTVEIVDVVLSDTIREDGRASTPLTRFASTTDNIYAVVAMKNTKQDSHIGYIHSYNGSYVDSEVSHPSRNGLAYFHFQWSRKPSKTRTAGDYSLQFYLDGKRSKMITYAIY